MLGQAGQPRKLVDVVVRTHAAAVGHVHAGDVHPATAGRDQPGVRVGVGTVGKAHDGILEAHTGKNGHAVPLARAMVHRFVTKGGKGHVREGGIAQFGLLEAQDIRLGVGNPLQGPLHADLQGIDVPGGDAHRQLRWADAGPAGHADPEGGMTTTWNSSARRPSSRPAAPAPAP